MKAHQGAARAVQVAPVGRPGQAGRTGGAGAASRALSRFADPDYLARRATEFIDAAFAEAYR